MQGSLIPFPEFKSKEPSAHPWGPVQAAATHSHPTERQRRDTGETMAATWHHTDQGLRSVGAGSPASLTHHPALLQRLQNRALFRLWSNQWLHKITSPLLQNNSKQNGSLNPCFPASFLFLSRNAHPTVQAAEFRGRHMAPAVLLSRRMCKARHTHCCSATPDTCCLRCWSTACLGKGRASLGLIPFWYCHSSENLVQPVLCCQVKHRACSFLTVTGWWAPSHSWDFPQDIAQGTALTVPLADWVKSKANPLVRAVTNPQCNQELDVLCCICRLSQCPPAEGFCASNCSSCHHQKGANTIWNSKAALADCSQTSKAGESGERKEKTNS